MTAPSTFEVGKRREAQKHSSRSKNSPSRIKSLILSSSPPPPLGDQLPKQTAAVMNVINMIDGISVSADLTPRAGVLGAGAAWIYPPSSPRTAPHHGDCLAVLSLPLRVANTQFGHLERLTLGGA